MLISQKETILERRNKTENKSFTLMKEKRQAELILLSDHPQSLFSKCLVVSETYFLIASVIIYFTSAKGVKVSVCLSVSRNYWSKCLENSYKRVKQAKNEAINYGADALIISYISQHSEREHLASAA